VREDGPQSEAGDPGATSLGTVLFVDVVGFSMLAAEEQVGLKRGLGAMLAGALQGLRAEDCITVDTGDGFAICYLGAPQDVLRVALALRQDFAARRARGEAAYSVRMGINLGPVHVLEDINGQRNAIGDGINTAQRIMGFAAPDQLLVSRSYHDVTSCLSPAYARVFAHVGVHEDKHVRPHEVWEVVGDLPETAAGPAAEPEPRAPSAVHFDPRVLRSVERDLAEVLGPLASLLVERAARRSRSLGQLYRSLGQEIPNPEERAAFLAGRDRLQ
jgi:class 3 adenylate cyclase